MEAIVLCGVQASGKTTLYGDRFAATHVRILMDLLRTRAREAAFLALCLETHQPFVVDNTNPTPAERRRYVEPAREAGFRVIAYLVEIDPSVALARNAERAGRARVPERGVIGTAKRFIRPSPAEGFDELWHATAAPDGWRIEPLLTTEPLF
jgi:predicted kinase